MKALYLLPFLLALSSPSQACYDAYSCQTQQNALQGQVYSQQAQQWAHQQQQQVQQWVNSNDQIRQHNQTLMQPYQGNSYQPFRR